MDINEYMDGIEKQNEELHHKLAAIEEENYNLKYYKSASRIMIDLGGSMDPPFWHINVNPEKIRDRKKLQDTIRTEIRGIEAWEHIEPTYLRIEMVRYYSDYTQRIWSFIIERDFKKDRLWRYTEHAAYGVPKNESMWGKEVDWLNIQDTM